MFRDRSDILVKIAFGFFVLFGSFLVLRPFLTAIMLSATLVVVSWPLYKKALSSFCGNKDLASLLLVLVMVVTILLPLTIVCLSITQHIPGWVSFVKDWIEGGMLLPPWVKEVPYIGSSITNAYNYGLDITSASRLIVRSFDSISKYLLSLSLGLGNGLIQLILVSFISFFIFRDGEVLAHKVELILNRISGSLTKELRDILVNTTRSVVFGVLGTAILQGLVAGIGFLIAGVPSVILLSFVVCVFSIIPMGPPLIWIPAAIWLYTSGSSGMAIFLVVWGTLAVSSVDNFIKPILISRGTSLPLSLVFLGVFGGMISFGILGIILGPIFLAAFIAMAKAWLKDKKTSKNKTVAVETSS